MKGTGVWDPAPECVRQIECGVIRHLPAKVCRSLTVQVLFDRISSIEDHTFLTTYLP